jgi:hypothetical protein
LRVSIELSLRIGPKGQRGEELFLVDVSNALFLADERASAGRISSLARLSFEKFTVARVERIVREFCKTCRGQTWHEVALLLMRLGRWEYEGMATP